MRDFIERVFSIRKNQYPLFLFSVISIIWVLFLYFGLDKFPKLKKYTQETIANTEYGLLYSIFMITSLAGFMGETSERITQVVLFLHSLTYSFLQ